MRERLAIYSPPYKGIKSYFEMVDIAIDHGLNKVEILNMMELSKPDIEFAKKLKAYADEKGVTFPCLSAGLQLVENTEGNIETLKRYADVAAVLGAPYLHHTIAYAWLNPDEVYSHKEEYFETGIKAVREVYDYAESVGVRVINEEQGFIFNGLENFRRYVSEVERNVGMVADFGNIFFVDENLEDMIPVFAERIVNAHVKDYKIIKKGEFEDLTGGYLTLGHDKIVDAHLGLGDVKIKKILEELKKIGYEGSIAMEAPISDRGEADMFEENLRYMEKLMSEIG